MVRVASIFVSIIKDSIIFFDSWNSFKMFDRYTFSWQWNTSDYLLSIEKSFTSKHYRNYHKLSENRGEI